jgi:hypothetical protein
MNLCGGMLLTGLYYDATALDAPPLFRSAMGVIGRAELTVKLWESVAPFLAGDVLPLGEERWRLDDGRFWVMPAVTGAVRAGVTIHF